MKKTIKTMLAGLLLFLPAASLLAQTNLDAAQPNAPVSAVSTMDAAPPRPADVTNDRGPRRQSEDIIALFASFGMPVAIVGLALFFKYRKDRLKHETVRAMIEKGVPLTPEVLERLDKKDPQDSSQPNQSRYLLPGLIMVAVGAALLISDHVGVGIPGLPGAGGWIILFVGVAFLIVWFVERNNKNDAQPPRA